jgi:hypothetical protein
VYNGWTRYSKDSTMVGNTTGLSVPCELMKYPWDVKRHQDFCINLRECKLDTLNIRSAAMCFSFNKGMRILIYVKKPVYDINMHIIQTPEYVSFGKSPKNCEDGKVLNPKTGRCIKVKLPKAAKAAAALQKKLGVDKQCPPGKVLNPKTGRCIKVKLPKAAKAADALQKKLAVDKPCPPGQMRSTKTGRCIKAKPQEKDCPPGKVRDPVSKRCIKLATAKKRKLV